MEGALIFISGLFLPMFCYLAEQVVPKPEVVEEIFKFILVYFLVKFIDHGKSRIGLALKLGASFVITETLFYFVNFYLLGRPEIVVIRILVTLSLHVLTYLILINGIISRKTIYYLISLSFAIVCHFLFNYFLRG